ETLRAEALILQKRTAEITHTNQYRFPRTVDTQRRTNGVGEFARVVADSALPQMAECGEVSPDLRIADADCLRDSPAGNRLCVCRPTGHASQVKAQALGGGTRQSLTALRWLAVQVGNLLLSEAKRQK